MAFRGLSTVASLTLGSRVLGLTRDAAMAVLFGAGPLMDAFSVAFRVPNLARRLFGEGSLTAAFLPAYTRVAAESPEAARRLTWSVAAALGGALWLATLAAEAVIGGVLAAGWGSEGLRTLLELTAVLLPYVVWICLAAQLSAVLHAAGRFFLPAALPLVLNAVWLAAIGAAAVTGWLPRSQMLLIAAAVSLSGVVQCALVASATVRLVGGPAAFGEAWRSSRAEIRAIAGAMLPTLVGLSITQFNAVLDSLLAWGLSPSAGLGWPLVSDGTATAMYLGQRMYQFPLGVFGVALGTVIYPVLARHAQAGDRPAMGRDLTRGLELSALIGLPASVGLMLLSRPVVRLLFEHGEFTAADTLLTSRMVAAYALAVWAFIGLLIVNRGFYAAGDTRTPLRAGLIAVVVNLVLNAALLPLLGGVGLAAATGLAAVVQLVWSVRRMRRSGMPIDGGSLRRTILATAAATAVMGVVVLSASRMDAGRIGNVAVPVVAGAAAYAAAAAALGLRRVVSSEL